MATRKRVRATLEQQAIIHFEQLRKDLQRLHEALFSKTDELMRVIDERFDRLEGLIDAVIAAARGEPRPPWAPPNSLDTKAHQLGNGMGADLKRVLDGSPARQPPPPQSDRRP